MPVFIRTFLKGFINSTYIVHYTQGGTFVFIEFCEKCLVNELGTYSFEVRKHVTQIVVSTNGAAGKNLITLHIIIQQVT